MRGHDEQQTREETKAERTGKPIKNPTFSDDQNHLRWKNLKQMDPEAMFEMIRDEVFPFIKELGGKNGNTYRQHMEGALFLFPKLSTRARAVELIDKLDLKDRDNKGDMYEYMLSKLRVAWQNGRLRPPPPLIKMMV